MIRVNSINFNFIFLSIYACIYIIFTVLSSRSSQVFRKNLVQFMGRYLHFNNTLEKVKGVIILKEKKK